MRYQFVDCRWSLDDSEFGRAQYAAQHIPGATFLDVERDLAAPAGTNGRHPLPAEADFARAAGRAGIGSDTFVVAYGSLGGAERLWWLLRHFGHDACAVIDLDCWCGPLREGDEEPEPAEFVPRARNSDTIETDELAAQFRELVVVDSRMPSRYRGEPNEIDRFPGRIRGARSALARPAARAPAGRARRVLRVSASRPA